MKILNLLIGVLFLSSCSPMVVVPTLKSGKCVRKPSSSFTIRYGDDRFHDDGELIDEIYHVYGTDTIHMYTKQRVRNSNPTKYVK